MGWHQKLDGDLSSAQSNSDWMQIYDHSHREFDVSLICFLGSRKMMEYDVYNFYNIYCLVSW